MKSPSEKKLSPQHSVLSTQHSGPSTASPRGSVIVLVVAVLALLAVIGTVYIVSARSERASTTAASSALNMDLAQKAIDNQATEAINNAMYDAQGILGGYAAYGPYGDHTARRWDIPEGNPAAMQFTTASPPLPTNPLVEWTNPQARNQAWLADGIFRYNSSALNPLFGIYQGVATPPPASPYYNSVSIFSPGVYNPADGLFDIPIYAGTGGVGLAQNFNSTEMFQSVADNILFRVTLPVPAANSSTTADADSYISLLPFSDASGIRYRYGLRIVDTSSMANLNVGLPYNFSAPPGQAAYGTFIGDYNLGSPSILNSGDNSALAQLMVARGGIPASDSIWNYNVLRSDDVGPPLLALFDTSDELELRSYGGFGTGLTPVPAQAWFTTLYAVASSPQPNLSRNFYTAYSYSRDLLPFPGLSYPQFSLATVKASPYTLTGMANSAQLNGVGVNVWPPFPARASANPILFSGPTTGTASTASDRMAEAATNIATAMCVLPVTSGSPSYSPQEASAFAANYITYHNTTGWVNVGTPQNPIIELPTGPSFIDSTGICVRGVGVSPGYAGAKASPNYGGAATLDLKTEVAAPSKFTSATPPNRSLTKSPC